MNARYRNTLFACAVAALTAAPGTLMAGQTPAPAQQNRQIDAGRQGDTSLASVAALTPEEVEGMTVVGSADEKIGKVDEVVRSRDDGLIYAVVSSGGVLGIGADKIPVPLQDMQRHGDALQLGIEKQALRNWPEYRKDRYVDLKPEDRPISEFSAFEENPSQDRDATPQPGDSR